MAGTWHRVRFRRDHRWAPPQMSSYLDAELRARARARMERHTAECPECRRVLGGLRQMLGVLHRLAQSDADAGVPDIAAAVRRRIHQSADR